MAKPLLTKSLSKRLPPLNKPIVWVPLSILALLSLFVWLYTRAGGSQQDGLSRSALSPDSEPAKGSPALSEIDTLELLPESSRGSGGATRPTAADRQLSPDLPADLALTTPKGTAAAASNQPSGSTDPFANYRAEYQFQSGSNAAANPFSSDPADDSSSRFSFGTGLVNPAAHSTNSALSEALKRQQAAREQVEGQTGQSSAQSGGLGEATPGQSSSRSGFGSATGDRANSATERNQPASIPGNPTSNPYALPYTSTTPAMSPPVGTTGYQRPAPVPPSDSTFPASQPLQRGPTSTPLPSAPNSPNSPGVLYTPPTFAQPDQGRPINPRQ